MSPRFCYPLWCLVSFEAIAGPGLKKRGGLGAVSPVNLPPVPVIPVAASSLPLQTESPPPPLRSPPRAEAHKIDDLVIPPLASPSEADTHKIQAIVLPIAGVGEDDISEQFYGTLQLHFRDWEHDGHPERGIPRAPADLGVTPQGSIVPGDYVPLKPLPYIAPFEKVPAPPVRLIPRQKGVFESSGRARVSSEAQRRKSVGNEGKGHVAARKRSESSDISRLHEKAADPSSD